VLKNQRDFEGRKVMVKIRSTGNGLPRPIISAMRRALIVARRKRETIDAQIAKLERSIADAGEPVRD
jgi:hypothetical protein